MMQRNFIYFINPVSGTKNKEPLLRMLEKRTGEQKIPFQILHTNAAADYKFLERKISEEKITDIIICGGDGTISQVAASLINVDVNIGIIPMGSGNGLALAAGISRNAWKALDVIFKGKAGYIDGFFINEMFSCMLCGLGFDALVAHQFAAHPSRGLSTYVKLSVKNFISAKSYRFEIETKDSILKADAFFISIANSNQFGNNFTIAPRASLTDGLLDIVIVHKTNKLRLVYNILKQVKFGKLQTLNEKNAGKVAIQYFQTDKLSIRNLSAAPLHIDGDPSPTAQQFKIQLIKNAMRLIQP